MEGWVEVAEGCSEERLTEGTVEQQADRVQRQPSFQLALELMLR